jgi:hypothetical protein
MPAASAPPPLDDPTQASRVKGFAAFFKSYMSVWTLVVAALPIPVGAFKLIPTFESQRSYLSVYTSLFCFLSLGFIFFERHRLGGYLFARTGKWKRSNLFIRNFPDFMFNLTRGFVNWLPLACILLSVYAVFRYQALLDDALLVAQAQATAEQQQGILPSAFAVDLRGADFSTQIKIANIILFEDRASLAALTAVENRTQAIMSEAEDKAARYQDWKWGSVPEIAAAYSRQSRNSAPEGARIASAEKFVGVAAKVPTFDDVLKTRAVPFGNCLMLWYLTIFVAAETAFIFMALKEYLQDLAHISDLSLMGLGMPEHSPVGGVGSAETSDRQ